MGLGALFVSCLMSKKKRICNSEGLFNYDVLDLFFNYIEFYIIINFKSYKISQNTHKLT